MRPLLQEMFDGSQAARTSIQRWKKILATQEIEALKLIPEAGRPGQLSEADLKWLSLLYAKGLLLMD